MKYPNFNQERKLKRKGYKRIVGLDEAGRGPLAGPVVVSGVIFPESLISFFKDLKDSKKISSRKREEILERVINDSNIEWEISKVYPKTIDKINILESTKLAMKRVVKKLKGDFLIVDGNFKILVNIPQKSVVKGDEKVISCSLASIIAKVKRDRMMDRYHKKYPQYGFNSHKGYPTKLHKERIKRNGKCLIHRKSFNC